MKLIKSTFHSNQKMKKLPQLNIHCNSNFGLITMGTGSITENTRKFGLHHDVKQYSGVKHREIDTPILSSTCGAHNLTKWVWQWQKEADRYASHRPIRTGDILE